MRDPAANLTVRRLDLAGGADTTPLAALLTALEGVAWFRLDGARLTVAYDVGRIDFAALVGELEDAGIPVDESGPRRWRGALYRLLDRTARGGPANQPTCCGQTPAANRRRR